MKGQSKIIVQVIFHIDRDLNNSKKQKKNSSGVELQTGELNLILKKNCNDRQRGTVCN